jgi:NAD(P)-dependent dehydrogenase (short-subunit alcohol dehydrogenase family)
MMWTGHLSKFVSPNPPGPVVQWLNARFHEQPWSDLLDGTYWGILFLFGTPLLGIIILCGTVVNQITYILQYWIPRNPPFQASSKSSSPSSSKMIGNDTSTTATTSSYPPPPHPVVLEEEVAIVITGCDTGFGQELAIRLAMDGFVVFAGCLNESSMEFFRPTSTSTATTKGGTDLADGSTSSSSSSDNNAKPNDDVALARIRPILLDVTNDEHVQATASYVEEWLLQFSSIPLQTQSISHSNNHTLPPPEAGVVVTTKRSLHAIVNNAGVGKMGYIDWLTMNDYTLAMDVNCFAHIRMTKAFLPILKRQSIEVATFALQDKERNNDGGSGSGRTFNNPTRAIKTTYPLIMNVISMAGTVCPTGMALSPYEISKAAAQTFTDSLRLEMKPWGVHVVAVCPSFHKTPMIENIYDKMMHGIWAPLDDQLKKEYGLPYMERYARHVDTMMRTQQWDSSVTVNLMAKTILESSSLWESATRPRPPPSRLNIGLDARLSLVAMSMFPAWVQTYLQQGMLPDQTPAALQMVESTTATMMTTSRRRHEEHVESANTSTGNNIVQEKNKAL